MNNTKQLGKLALLFIIIGGTIIIGLLQYRYAFHLLFLEQLQLFLFGKEYAIDLLSRPGGTIEYVSEYCIQFFSILYVGSICTTLFLLLIGFVLHRLLKNGKEKGNWLFIFEGSILFFLLLNLLDMGFFFRGVVGYLFCVIALLGYDRVQKYPSGIRFLYGLLSALLLFWLAAPFQTLFLIVASCIEFREHGLNKGKSLLPLILAGMVAYLVYIFGKNSTYRMYVALDGVCSPGIIPGWTKYVAWLLLPVAILFTPGLERLAGIVKKNYILVLGQGCLILTVLIFLLPRYDDHDSLVFKQLHYYASQERWDDLLAYCRKHPLKDHVICLNYQNLALAEKGILADSLLFYPQKGKQGLLVPWDRTVYTAFVVQKVCYSYGDIAFARKFAFEGNVCSSTFGFPETMKTLVRTNILQKQFRVAAKYIHYLQQTFSYKEWADKQCRYLSGIDVPEDDPEYKGKHKFLEKKDHFASPNEFRVLSAMDKNDKKLRDFVLCSFLLEKDMENFLSWFGFYYNEASLKDVPVIYYQALLICASNIPEVLNRYRVPDFIKDEFELYTLTYRRAKNPEDRRKWLSVRHANSFWFYFHYANVDYE
ncbi:DUF6057 family protein [Parabacteroides pacaensis]|uniref:DUF6057 family protein n=1 Tax=Parabacteroides pacaensis TaxID=2086575 RepID=UPI000D10FF7E|nr:DUF6057 family protein [Parabacteroides pacaensis]